MIDFLIFSALESEVERLKTENLELTEKLGQTNFDDSPAWGAPEDEVLLTSSDNNNALLELEAEISELKQKIRGDQEEKAKLNEDINAAKVKHGKLTLKVKNSSYSQNSSNNVIHKIHKIHQILQIHKTYKIHKIH